MSYSLYTEDAIYLEYRMCIVDNGVMMQGGTNVRRFQMLASLSRWSHAITSERAGLYIGAPGVIFTRERQDTTISFFGNPSNIPTHRLSGDLVADSKVCEC